MIIAVLIIGSIVALVYLGLTAAFYLTRRA